MQAQINIFDEIIVDNFAGGGGASTGMELATGKPVTIAINHDPDAVAMHLTNHPYTQHYCESVWDIDPVTVCASRPVGLAWFSPDCKHFSKAKGGKPVNKNIRGLAWVVLRWAAKVKPRVIMLENVEEFQTWGPIRKGKPIKKRAGETFSRWRWQLEALGYQVEMRELRACDYGAPTIRKRFFVIARRDGKPIVWPEPTHGAPDSEAVRSGKLLPWRTAAEIIDWSLPCPSIFDTAEEIMEKHGLRAQRPLKEATLRRIARGIQKFVIENPDPFIVGVNHTANYYDCFRGQSINEPYGTVTAKNGNGIVVPILAGVGGRAAQCNSRSADNPILTTTAKADVCLLTPTLIQYHGEKCPNEVRGQSLEDPILTIDGSNRYGMAAATMIQMGYGEAPGLAPRVPGVDKPIGTIVTKGKHVVVTAFLSKYYAGGYTGKGNATGEPLNTITSVDHNALVTANLIKFQQNSMGQDPHEPVHTVMPGEQRFGIVTSNLCILRNNCTGQPVNEPINTIMTSPGHFAEVRAFLVKYYGQGNGQSVDKPLHTATAQDRFGLVTIAGMDYAIVDIGLRMLTPRELFLANGFPPDYIIDRDNAGKAYPKSKQVARCGNAVPPQFAEALVRANLPELCGKKIGTMAELESQVAI